MLTLAKELRVNTEKTLTKDKMILNELLIGNYTCI